MLQLPEKFRDAIVAHARRDHPDEAVGVLVGREGAPERMVELTNAERSPTGFVPDSGEWLRLHKQLDDDDAEIVVLYHSHTMTEAYPSRTDIRWSANTPGVSWLLVSTRPELGDEVELRSFRIDGGTVTEEPVQLVAGP
ncbi:MAG: Mov34/MPN/PAD family protein [Mycobacterium sp.]|nr:Mov34/MPN/PAD family protein [Mycobacterium sp.]